MRLRRGQTESGTATQVEDPSPTRRWSRRRVLILGMVLVVLAVASWFVWGRGSEAEAQAITATVERQEVTRTVSGTGTLTPVNDETLSFEVSGTVTEVRVALGDTVKKNQVLATIDDSLLQDQVTAATSAVTSAQQGVTTAQSSGSAVQLAAANSQLVTAKDDLATAKESVKNAVLRAPFAGHVVSLDLAEGDVVGNSTSGGNAGPSMTGSTSSSATSSVQIASVDQFLVDTTVSASEIEQISKGLQAEISATGVTDTLYGTVTSVGRVASANSSGGAVFPVTVTLTGTVEDVYGGISASVDIIIEKRSDVLTVPTQAIRTADGATVVRLIDENGDVREQEVTLGEAYGTVTEVLDGVSEGDTIEVMAARSAGGGSERGSGGGREGGFSGELPDGFSPPDMAGGMPGGGNFSGPPAMGSQR